MIKTGLNLEAEMQRFYFDAINFCRLADLMAEMPQGLPRAEGWDDMPSVGLESV